MTGNDRQRTATPATSAATATMPGRDLTTTSSSRQQRRQRLTRSAKANSKRLWPVTASSTSQSPGMGAPEGDQQSEQHHHSRNRHCRGHRPPKQNRHQEHQPPRAGLLSPSFSPSTSAPPSKKSRSPNVETGIQLSAAARAAGNYIRASGLRLRVSCPPRCP